MPIPVYLFVGFLESGKTSFIQETMEDPRFNAGEKTLLLLCEEGVEEYEPSKFVGGGKNVAVEVLETPEELTREKLESFQKQHRMQRVVLEYNGMWMLSVLQQALPKDWQIYQCFMTVDAATFENYMANMGPLMADKIGVAEFVAFNRCTQQLDKKKFHKAVRLFNRRADIAFEYPSGRVEYDDIVDELPFDLNADVIEIGAEDFGLWYLDASDNPKKYVGKTVRFTAMVYRSDKLPKNTFVPGRFGMTCCAEDISFVGFLCKYDQAQALENESWIRITAEVKCKYHAVYQGEGPILIAKGIEPAEKPKEELVYFR